MGSRQNNYGLETNWSRVIGNVNALAGNFEPTSSLNGSRGVGIMMGTQGNAKALQGDRVFIAGQRTVDALQTQMVAQKTYVAGMYPNFNGSGASYIIKASWFRANTRARLEYTKWAKLRRMEASIQNELHRRAASVSCSYIVPGVMFHGFVEGVFYVVSHMPGKLTPIDTFLASTPAKAMLAYRAVEGTIHALWMLDATPMRVAKHTFALLSNGRGFYPMAIVLDYNNVLAFNEPVRRELRGKMTTYIGQQNVCAPLRSKEGTLEHIWSAFRSSAAWRGAAQKYKDIFVKKHKSEKDVGQYLRNILMFAKRLDASRGSGASRKGPGAPPRRRRTMLGGALRGILRGRGGGRRASSNNEKSPPLKIRKVATLPETDGWRPRKHSATWGAASRNTNTNNNGGRRVSRNPGPRYITSGTSGNGSSTYTPAAKTADSDSDGDGEGEESSAPRVGNGTNGLGAGILGAANANAAANANQGATQANRNNVNRYKRIRNSWPSWTEAQKNEAVKTEIKKLEEDPSLRAALNAFKKGPEVERVVHGALYKDNPESYGKQSNTLRAESIRNRLNIAFQNNIKKYTKEALQRGEILGLKQHMNVIKKKFADDAEIVKRIPWFGKPIPLSPAQAKFIENTLPASMRRRQ